MPQLHLQNFIVRLINDPELQFFNNRDYIAALLKLQTYIIEEIENRGKFLVASEDILNGNFKELLDVNEIGFLNQEGGKADYLVKQSSLFRNLFNINKEFNIWTMIKKEISESSDEEFFNVNFTKKEWPIKFGGL